MGSNNVFQQPAYAREWLTGEFDLAGGQWSNGCESFNCTLAIAGSFRRWKEESSLRMMRYL